MAKTFSFYFTEDVNTEGLPKLKSPQTFASDNFPEKGDRRRIKTECGKSIYVTVVEKDMWGNVFRLGVIPTNGVGKKH